MKSVFNAAIVAVAGAGFSLTMAGLAHAGGPTDTTGQFYSDASSTLKARATRSSSRAAPVIRSVWTIVSSRIRKPSPSRRARTTAARWST